MFTWPDPDYEFCVRRKDGNDGVHHDLTIMFFSPWSLVFWLVLMNWKCLLCCSSCHCIRKWMSCHVMHKIGWKWKWKMQNWFRLTIDRCYCREWSIGWMNDEFKYAAPANGFTYTITFFRVRMMLAYFLTFFYSHSFISPFLHMNIPRRL